MNTFEGKHLPTIKHIAEFKERIANARSACLCCECHSFTSGRCYNCIINDCFNNPNKLMSIRRWMKTKNWIAMYEI